MADKINAYGSAGLDISQARNREVNKAEQSADASAGQKPEPGRDAVDFSSTASFLRRTEASLKEQPEVDQARVDEIRQKIQSGNYEVSAERVAAKLMRLEQGLG